MARLNIFKKLAFIITASSACLLASPAQAADMGYAAAVAAAKPAVVNIYTSHKLTEAQKKQLQNPILRFYFGDQMPRDLPQQNSLGSGVLVDKKGHILTNYHVIRGASDIEVAFANGKRIKAKLIGSDAATDLAVLQVKNGHLNPIRLANINQARVGDIVLAIGNPFGLGQTVTQGIISAMGRDSLGINQFENFIQTDAAINPGNSGGALVTADGRLIGINSAIFSKSGGNQGIGFAIPIDLAERVMNSILKHGKVVRGWLGVSIINMNAAVAKKLQTRQKTGIGVIGVALASPAYTAGLRVGDVILRANAELQTDTHAFMRSVAAMRPGDQLALTVIRGNSRKTKKLIVRIGERPAEDTAQNRWESLRQQPQGGMFGNRRR